MKTSHVGIGTFFFIAGTAAWLGTAAPAAAQTALLSSATPAAFTLIHGTYGTGGIVSVSGEPFPQAWQVSVTHSAPSSQSVVLSANTAVAVAAGDAIVATFWYRRTDTTADEVNISARFESATAPVASAVVVPLRGREQWRQVSIPFLANASYAAGAARFDFALSAQIQSLQVSGVTLTDYGQKSLFGPGITDATPFFTFTGSAPAGTYATDSGVAVTGNPFFSSASHIAVTAVPPVDSYVKLSANVPQAVASGDTLVAIFWVRDADAVPQNAVVGITAQQAIYPTAQVYNQSALIVDGAWKQHIIPFTANASCSANGMQILVKCAAQLQTVEFGGLQLLDLGNAPALAAATLTSTVNDYPGRLLTDSWRADADARIAAYRKGDFTLDVTDGNGNAINGVTVAAAMQKHLFGFGSAVRANELTTVTGTDADTYRAKVKGLFNKVVFENEMKWIQWETANDPHSVQNAISWLWGNGIFNVRGHNLVWPSWGYCPSDVASLSGSALTSRILGHIDNETGYFKIKNYMQDWDVVNEPYVNHTVLDKINGVAAGSRGTIAQDAVAMKPWYAQVATDDAFPFRFLNDAGVVEVATHIGTAREDYNYALLSELISTGAAIDGFGFESHFTAATPPLTVKEIFDRFAGLGIREEVTEFDQNVADPILQADYLADYMTMVFSEPQFDSFLMWGFWDTLHWLGNSPLYAADWTLKPSGEAWQGLVFGKWWTNASATSDASGAATVNGFLGRYAVTAGSGGITKVYYADLPRTGGARLNVKLSGTPGTTHVWLHQAEQAVQYSPFAVVADANAYDGYCVTSPGGSGNATSATTGLIRIDTPASGTVNIWLRVIAPDSTHDAFWLSVDGETFQNVTLTQGTSWHWVLWKQAVLASGSNHIVYVADADGGTELDQVLITDDLAFTP